MEWTVENIKWFFQQPASRQLDNTLLDDTLNVVFPKMVRVVFYVLPALMVVIIGTMLTILIQNTDIKGELRLMNSPAVTSGKVLDVEKRKGSKGSMRRYPHHY